MSEHGSCPACGTDLNGGLIWETLRETRSEEEADRVAAQLYGATRTSGHWGREIGTYDVGLDRVVAWRCPDCGHQWERDAEQSRRTDAPSTPGQTTNLQDPK